MIPIIHYLWINSKPEIIVRKYLFSHGFRFRKNDKRYPGKPDIVLPKYKTIIFIHGCFWHMHEGCSDFIWPKSNVEDWKPKIEKNHQRDVKNVLQLRNAGWRVIIIWECALKKDHLDITLSNLSMQLKELTDENKDKNKKVKGVEGIVSPR
jgi:DNA mismatch endonuclease (patch repair protein)